jgi:hypothetical protein
VLATAIASSAAAGNSSQHDSLEASACSPGYVDAHLSWGEKCLHAGEFCKAGNVEYHAYGFRLPHLRTPDLLPSGDRQHDDHRHHVDAQHPRNDCDQFGAGLARRRNDHPARAPQQDKRLHGWREPDRRCSPGAYYTGLTKAVVCSAGFHTPTVRNVPQSEKYAVEVEYGMPARLYGRTIEIDHIVSLELGGSNDIANLYPEPGSGPASYNVKDRLENKLHDLVCSGAMTLRAAQLGIARNWQALYKNVFGVAPSS